MVGNPPYVTLSPTYFASYNMTKGNNNTYIAFFEKSIELLKSTGIIGFIIPNTWFAGDNYLFFREHLLENISFDFIVQLPYDIFNAYVDTSIIIGHNKKTDQQVKTYKYDITVHMSRTV